MTPRIPTTAAEAEQALDAVLAASMPSDVLPLSAVGALLGDSPLGPVPGAAGHRLALAAKAGALATLDDANWRTVGSYRIENLDYASLRIAKAALAAWLAAHGTSADKSSRAAVWCA